MTFTEKYRPDKLCDVVGQQQHVIYLSNWAKEWINGIPKQKALILHGKAGIGKTSLAHALAHEMSWQIIELNASEQRTAGVINRVAGSASRTGTLDDAEGRKLIILDEADNMHGTHDRGGNKALVDLVKNTSQPIIIIVNNFYKLDPLLRNICKSLQFKNVSNTEISKLLFDICKKEDIKIEKKVVEHIVEISNGDVRAAVNDLESVCIGKTEVGIQDVVAVDEKQRNVSETIFTFVEKVFKEKDIKKVLELSYNISENPESTIFWLDENIPLVHKDANKRYESYDLLSKADIFLGRVRKRQNYDMWKYANTLICGINTVDSVKLGFVRYSPPKYWSKLKQNKVNRNIKKSVMQKIGKICHISTEKVSEMFWLIKQLMKDEHYSVIVAYEIDFCLAEIAYLLNCNVDSKKAKDIYAVIQELKEDDVELEDVETESLVDSVSVSRDKPKSQMSLGDF